MFLRTLYLFQLYGFKRFFLKISNVLYCVSMVLGSIAIILLFLHIHVDIFDNDRLRRKLATEFINLYEPVVRESLLMGIIALFTFCSVFRILFLWFLSPNFDLLKQTFHYINGIILTILVIFFYFCVILYHYLPNLLQYPAFASYSIALTYGFSFRQLTKNLMFSESVFLQFVLCIISSTGYFLSRLLIVFFYSISQCNRTYNMFYVIDRRHLGSIIFDQKYKKEIIMYSARGGPGDPNSPDFDPFYRMPPLILSERKIRKLKFIAIKTLLNFKKGDD